LIQTKFKTSYVLSIIILLLAAVASAGGLVISDLYRDNAFVKRTWFANDAMTLIVAVPLLIAALAFTRRGSPRALLIWMGLLMYMVYNYAFYLFAAAFNRFFLLYVALFSLPVLALIFALSRLDANALSRQFAARTPVRLIAGFMLFFSLLLGGMWIGISLGVAVSGQIPEMFAKFGHPTNVVFALDLSILMPGMVLGAVLLWRRQPWGYVVGAMMNIKAVTYALVLIVSTIYSLVIAGVGDDLLPLYIILGAGNLIACTLLLGNMQSEHQVEIHPGTSRA
jgi:hypothetical protein